MKRRSFFGWLVATAAASFEALRPASVFASEWSMTFRSHPELQEWGIGFECTPDILGNAEWFHRGCETMRRSMLAGMGKHGPINVWRAGSADAVRDTKTGQWYVALRQRAARIVPLEPKPEGAPYTFFKAE